MQAKYTHPLYVFHPSLPRDPEHDFLNRKFDLLYGSSPHWHAAPPHEHYEVTRGWYPGLVSGVGIRGWYPGMVSGVGIRGWYPGLVKGDGIRGWYPGLVSRDGIRGW